MAKHNAIQIGDKRGKLAIIGRDPSGTLKHPRYFVRCDCGNEYSSTGTSLTKARGCRKCTKGGQPRKYGDRVVQGETLYLIWAGMRYRCQTDHPKNKRWFGRGIKVCDEWNDFAAFEKWALENGYQAGLSLDRHPNNDGNYEPSNCEWVTRSTNSKRARALYRFVHVEKIIHRASFYDESCFGDF